MYMNDLVFTPVGHFCGAWNLILNNSGPGVPELVISEQPCWSAGTLPSMSAMCQNLQCAQSRMSGPVVSEKSTICFWGDPGGVGWCTVSKCMSQA